MSSIEGLAKKESVSDEVNTDSIRRSKILPCILELWKMPKASKREVIISGEVKSYCRLYMILT